MSQKLMLTCDGPHCQHSTKPDNEILRGTWTASAPWLNVLEECSEGQHFCSLACLANWAVAQSSPVVVDNTATGELHVRGTEIPPWDKR